MPQAADVLFLAEWAIHSTAIVEVQEYLCHFRIHTFNASSRHMYDADYFIRDEWRLMQRILPWFEEGPLRRALRRVRLACLLAARVQVKMDLMARLRPDKVEEFGRIRRELVGWAACTAGTAVVRSRDVLRRLKGQPTRADELMQPRGHD
jgi:hypothetical protein